MLLIVITPLVFYLFLLGMIKTLGLAQNWVDCLALNSSGNFLFKNLQTFYCQPRVDIKKEEPEELSCWQDPPDDVKEMIVRHMSFSSRVRLSSLCNSWRTACMQREIPTCPQLPWLVHPQPKTGNRLSFSSLSEGKVFKSRLPFPDLSDFKSRVNRLSGRTNRTSSFLNSSRGWLVMKEWELFRSLMIDEVLVFFLVNPVSGAQHRLPPLQTIPGYKENSIDSYLGQVVLSNPDLSKTMVAATLGKRKLLLCRPRDKSWRVFQVLDENDSEGCIVHVLFSSTGILYALVKNSSNCGGEVWIENLSLKFGDDEELELKVIYDKVEWWIDEGLFIQEGNFYEPYLSESTNSELLLIYHIRGPDVGEDEMEGNVDAEEGNDNGEGDENNNMDAGNVRNYESLLGWVGQPLRKALRLMHLKSFINDDTPENSDTRTRCFRVYKIDQDNNRFRRVQNLGGQILFLANDYSSLSLLASDFKEVRGNCIYFAMREKYGIIHTSHEIGIFYLDNEKIERSFPSFEMTEYSKFSWLIPSLW